MDFSSCRLCLKKHPTQFVNALLVPQLCKSITSFFGFQILKTDKFSKRVCEECVSTITESLSYKNRVIYNQECIQQQLLIHSQVHQIIKTEVSKNDDVILIDDASSENNDDTVEISSTQNNNVTTTETTTKSTARKSTAKPAVNVEPAPSPVKVQSRKRLKIVCRPISESDVKSIRLDSKTRSILKLHRKSSNVPLTGKQKACLDVMLKRTQMKNQGPPKGKPVESNPSSANRVRRNSIPLESSVCAPTRSSANQERVVFSVLPPSSTSKPTTPSPASPNNSLNINKSPSKVIRKYSSLSRNIFTSICLPNAQDKIKLMRVHLPTSRNSSVNPLPNIERVQGANANVLVANKSQDAIIHTPPPVVHSTVANNTVLVTTPSVSSIQSSVTQSTLSYGIAKLNVDWKLMSKNNSVSTQNKHNYAKTTQPSASPILEKNETVWIPASTLANSDSILPKAMPLPQNSVPPAPQRNVKILSVTELNSRVPTPPASSTAPPEIIKTERLPIRISLTKVRNEMVIKLSDPQGVEMHYVKLHEYEKNAVRNSLLSKESMRQFSQAFQMYSPDEYTTKLLDALGLTRQSFIV